MWIGNIKVKEKITETLIFFCQVLMIFFLPFYLTSMTITQTHKISTRFFIFFNCNYDGEEVEPDDFALNARHCE